jgi:hypothetical protein
LYRKVGGPRAVLGGCLKTSLPPGFDTQTVQPVPSRYTDGAILAYIHRRENFKIKV